MVEVTDPSNILTNSPIRTTVATETFIQHKYFFTFSGTDKEISPFSTQTKTKRSLSYACDIFTQLYLLTHKFDDGFHLQWVHSKHMARDNYKLLRKMSSCCTNNNTTFNRNGCLRTFGTLNYINRNEWQDPLLLLCCYQSSFTIFDFSNMNFPSLYFCDAS